MSRRDLRVRVEGGAAKGTVLQVTGPPNPFDEWGITDPGYWTLWCRASVQQGIDETMAPGKMPGPPDKDWPVYLCPACPWDQMLYPSDQLQEVSVSAIVQRGGTTVTVTEKAWPAAVAMVSRVHALARHGLGQLPKGPWPWSSITGALRIGLGRFANLSTSGGHWGNYPDGAPPEYQGADTDVSQCGQYGKFDVQDRERARLQLWLLPRHIVDRADAHSEEGRIALLGTADWRALERQFTACLGGSRYWAVDYALRLIRRNEEREWSTVRSARRGG